MDFNGFLATQRSNFQPEIILVVVHSNGRESLGGWGDGEMGGWGDGEMGRGGEGEMGGGGGGGWGGWG
ncbi:hypothetical protein, partial [Okeania sp. SIO3B5]|uniref:hypothetical protein n=1 Tax=Okeania sp. SIO3B5 TaxID=2607811 RepID=UPI0025F20F14